MADQRRGICGQLDRAIPKKGVNSAQNGLREESDTPVTMASHSWEVAITEPLRVSRYSGRVGSYLYRAPDMTGFTGVVYS